MDKLTAFYLTSHESLTEQLGSRREQVFGPGLALSAGLQWATYVNKFN
jgi:hypothetical protein